jgi:Ca-activated chloride channel family protein
MNCDRIQTLLTSYLLGDLDETQASEVARHLSTCDGCRALLQEIEPTLDLLRDALAAPSPSPPALLGEHRLRIRETLLEQSGNRVAWIFQEHRRLTAVAAGLLVAVFIYVVSSPLTDRKRGYVANRGKARDGKEAVGKPDGESPVESPDKAMRSDLARAKQQVEDLNAMVRERNEEVTERDTEISELKSELREVMARARQVRTDGGPVLGGDEGEMLRRRITGGVPVEARRKPSNPTDAATVPLKVEYPKPLFIGTPKSIKSDNLEPDANKDTGNVAWGGSRQSVPEKAKRVAGRMVKKPGTGKTTPPATSPVVKRAPVMEPARPEDLPAVAETSTRMSGEETAEREGSEMVSFTEGEKTVKGITLESGTTLSGPKKRTEMSQKLARADDGTTRYWKDFDGDGDTPVNTMMDDVAGDREPGEPRVEKEKLRRIKSDGRTVAGVGLSTIPEGVPDPDRGGQKHEAKARGPATKEADKKVDEMAETGARFKAVGENPWVQASVNAFSTFGIDVDTASYTLARNYMLRGFLPPAEAVRTEEFVNFFDYAYAAPTRDTFKVYAEAAPSRFGVGKHMIKIGVKGRRLGREEQRPAVLTFLIDTSGSMDKPDRIGLVKTSLKLMLDKLGPQDKIAIMKYDTRPLLVLEHTSAAQKDKILKVVEGLRCRGTTNLELAMTKAYQLASQNFAPGGENRVLLLSDGVANVGTQAAEDILGACASARKQGIFSSVFGFGIGTYNDEMLEGLANKGDGAYTFIDSEKEARRVFVQDLSATLNTIASDVKIQVEFNPKRVKQYRQLGYENRQLTKEQFRDDSVDAGEVGSGQSVTALYETELKTPGGKADRERLAVVRVRYRRRDNGKIEEIAHDIMPGDVAQSFGEASARFRLAACVAEFAEQLRNSEHARGGQYPEVARVLRPVAAELSLDGRVAELLRMVSGAHAMSRGM